MARWSRTQSQPDGSRHRPDLFQSLFRWFVHHDESQRTTARFFDTSAFTIAPQFTIGNSSRNPVRGPQYRNADVAQIRRTYFGEYRNIEFRAEIFNLTNIPPLGAPATVAGAASITSAGDPRVIQFGLKLNF